MSSDIVLKRISVLIFFIAVITDWYDGWYARKYKSITKTGIFLDPLADKILTSTAFIFFYLKNIFPLWMLITIITRDVVITLLRSYDEYYGVTLKTSFNAKVKTFVQMTYIFLILIIGLILTYETGSGLRNLMLYFLQSNWNYALMFALTILTIYTGLEYFFEKFKQAKSIADKEKENN